MILALGAAGLAQNQAARSSAAVPVLLTRLEDKDDRVAIDAVSQLIALGSSAAPELIGALRDRHGCRLQWVASLILNELKLEPLLVTTTLINIATGHCEASSPDDLMLKRQAALLVVDRVEGIPVMAAMLTEKDVFLRRSAAFAFDELTEGLDEPTTEVLEATRKALPFLLQAALRDEDEVVRCMSYESLDQARRSKHESLRLEATRLLEEKTIPCAR